MCQFTIDENVNVQELEDLLTELEETYDGEPNDFVLDDHREEYYKHKEDEAIESLFNTLLDNEKITEIKLVKNNHSIRFGVIIFVLVNRNIGQQFSKSLFIPCELSVLYINKV